MWEKGWLENNYSEFSESVAFTLVNKSLKYKWSPTYDGWTLNFLTLQCDKNGPHSIEMILWIWNLDLFLASDGRCEPPSWHGAGRRAAVPPAAPLSRGSALSVPTATLSPRMLLLTVSAGVCEHMRHVIGKWALCEMILLNNNTLTEVFWTHVSWLG